MARKKIDLRSTQSFENDEIIESVLNPTMLYPEDKKTIEELPSSILFENMNNHFHKIEGEKWDEFVASVREMGVQVPLIVRQKNRGYEIIAGHNRKRAAEEVGLKTLPCMIVDVDDIDASVLMAITNNQRENTTELEWGWAYRTTYETLVRSVGNPNGFLKISSGEKEQDDDKSPNAVTVTALGKKGRTEDIVAEKYGVSARTITRKIRLTHLFEPLYDYCKKGKIKQDVMIELSYVDEDMQIHLLDIVQEHKVPITMELAKALKDKKGMGINELNDYIKALKDEDEKKGDEKKKKVLKYTVPEDLFPSGVDPGDKKSAGEYIAKALSYIKENGIKI